MESRFVYTVILFAGSLYTQGRLICGLASHAESSSTCLVSYFSYNGATALVAKASLSRIHYHIQLNTTEFSPKVMSQSTVFLRVLENPY
jgi:hypothetical protein